MPQRKKSEIQGAGKRNASAGPPPVKRRKASQDTIRQVSCPVCGSLHGVYRTSYGPEGESVNYWEWLNEREIELGYQDDPPFGIIQEVGKGRGKCFTTVGHFGPEDDPDGYFPLVKARLLRAVRIWASKGWVTEGEVKKVMK